MLDAIIQHLQLMLVLGATGLLVMFFGAIIAVSVYAFIWAHVAAYYWLKGVVTRGVVPDNA